jgi:hypothetical protein
MEAMPGVSCRRCGADPLATGVPYIRRIRVEAGDGAGEVVMTLCVARSRDFGSEQERDEYLRLGFLA